MINEITLDKYVADEIPEVKKIIKNSYQGQQAASSFSKYKSRSIYTSVVESLSDGTRNTGDQLNYFEAFEKALAVFRTSSLELRKAMNILTLEQRFEAQKSFGGEISTPVMEKQKDEMKGLEREIADSIFFSNRYALYMAGNVGLSLLKSEMADVKNTFSFGNAYDISKDRDSLTKWLGQVANEDFIRITSEKTAKGDKIKDEDLKYTLEAIFTSWINQFSWQPFESVIKGRGIEDLTLKYDTYSLKNGEFKRKSNIVVVDDKLMKIGRKDVIGNVEYVNEVYGSLKRLLAWNEEKKRNPLNPPGAIFTFGDPGLGKTFSAHALMQESAELAKKQGIPFWAFPFSITDIASTFKDETPMKLNEIINQINSFRGPVAMYMADADVVIPSRENAHATPEDNKLAGVFFSMFDGSRIPKGKFMPIMDANFMDKMGDAIKSRITSAKLLYLKRFEKPEDFAAYANSYMTKDGDEIGVKEDEWLEIGKYLLSTKVNNREIANILGDLRGGFDTPEELLAKGYDEQVRFRQDYTKSITKDKIVRRFTDFIQTRMDIERKSREERQRQQDEQAEKDLVTSLDELLKSGVAPAGA